MKMRFFASWTVALAVAVAAPFAAGVIAPAFAFDIRPHNDLAEGVWIVPQRVSDRDACSPAHECDRGELREISRAAEWLLLSKLAVP
jgi:hypothetical protein